MHSIPLAEDDVAPTLADPALDLSSDLRGTLVAGRHELAELFFHGEQGSVYLGRDTHSNRPIEVKILASEAATTAAVDRFRERSRRMLGLSHPGIAAVLGEGITENGLPFVVMEHREGRNLHHLQGDPRLAWPAPEAVLRQLAEALAALHALGVVHGAISAGNIVWIEDGSPTPRVQLVDREFNVPASDEFAAFDRGGDPRGSDTPPADDLHALGAVVYELCTGRLPSAAPLSMHQGDTQVAVPERFESIVLALVDPDPAGRPTSAVALLDLLDRATSGMQPGDLDFLAALGEPEPTRFADRFASTDRAEATPGARFVVHPEAPEPATASASLIPALDTSSPAHALAAAMDAFGMDDPPDRQRVPIPESPRPARKLASASAPDLTGPADSSTSASTSASTSTSTPASASASISVSTSASTSAALSLSADPILTSAEATPPASRADGSASDPRLLAATPTLAPGEPTTATLTARSEPSTTPLARQRELPPERTRLLLLVVGAGLVLILLAWLFRGSGAASPTAPQPAPVTAPTQPPHAERRVEPEPAGATLASGAAQALPAGPEPTGEPAAAPTAPQSHPPPTIQRLR